MAEVDFYIIASAAEAGGRIFACRVAEKAWRLGHRVFVHTESRESASEMDALLWTFREDSFVPHELDSTTPAGAPVLIGAGEPPARDPDVLINLTSHVPPFASRSPRIAEIVTGDEHARELGRERFRRYRADGFEIRTHVI